MDAISRRRAWGIAARPHTLPAAATPVLVAAGLAQGDGTFRLPALVAAMIAALAIQVAANFANDVSDAARGADPADRLGPPRMVAAGMIAAPSMWRATALSLAVAALAGAWLFVLSGWPVLIIGSASVLAMLGYVSGPLPYGYRGLGEIFVFIFFGVVAMTGSRYVHDGSIPVDAWLLSIPVGFLVTAILVVNNLRDINTDARTGKRTLAVLIGKGRTRLLYIALVAGAFLAIALFAAAGLTPAATAFALVLAPVALPLLLTVSSTEEGPRLVQVLKGTALLHLAVGLALMGGAIL